MMKLRALTIVGLLVLSSAHSSPIKKSGNYKFLEEAKEFVGSPEEFDQDDGPSVLSSNDGSSWDHRDGGKRSVLHDVGLHYYVPQLSYAPFNYDHGYQPISSVVGYVPLNLHQYPTFTVHPSTPVHVPRQRPDFQAPAHPDASVEDSQEQILVHPGKAPLPELPKHPSDDDAQQKIVPPTNTKGSDDEQTIQHDGTDKEEWDKYPLGKGNPSSVKPKEHPTKGRKHTEEPHGHPTKGGQHPEEPPKKGGYMPYSYSYETDHVTKTESGDENGLVEGSYSYVDGAGVKRTVTYKADQTGFYPEGDLEPDGGDPNIKGDEGQVGVKGFPSPPVHGPKTPINLDGRHNDGANSDNSFEYSYKTDHSSKQEKSDRDGNVEGTYTYMDGAGVERTVTYTAKGEEGFIAKGDLQPDKGDPNIKGSDRKLEGTDDDDYQTRQHPVNDVKEAKRRLF